jgi:hypothetical protein
MFGWDGKFKHFRLPERGKGTRKESDRTERKVLQLGVFKPLRELFLYPVFYHVKMVKLMHKTGQHIMPHLYSKM